MPVMKPTAGKATPAEPKKKKKKPFLMRWMEKRGAMRKTKGRKQLYDEAGK